MRQLPLDLPVEPSYSRDDFLVSPSNRLAFDMIERWPDWPDRVLVLVGPSGAGKSHLGAIWAERAGAAIVPATRLSELDLQAVASQPMLLEDAQETAGAEAAFFHLLNLVRASQGWLVLTAVSRPDFWGLKTADLLSRLRLAPVVEIFPPDDDLVRAVLVKLFADRQLTVEATVIDFLALHIERSLDAARAVVGALDREALALGRRVTRAMAGDIIRRMEDVS